MRIEITKSTPGVKIGDRFIIDDKTMVLDVGSVNIQTKYPVKDLLDQGYCKKTNFWQPRDGYRTFYELQYSEAMRLEIVPASYNVFVVSPEQDLFEEKMNLGLVFPSKILAEKRVNFLRKNAYSTSWISNLDGKRHTFEVFNKEGESPRIAFFCIHDDFPERIRKSDTCGFMHHDEESAKKWMKFLKDTAFLPEFIDDSSVRIR